MTDAFELSYPERNQPIQEPQNIGELLDGCSPFVALDPDTEVTLPLKISGNDFTKMFSALMVGAELTYPDECYAIWARLLAAAHCPPELPSEAGDCYAYPPYSPFISYSPSNPFIDPNETPPEWLSPPFVIYDGGGSLPPDYIAGDIIVPYSAITLNPFDIFGGQLPTIQIKVVGSGQVEIDLLATGLGGLCAVSLNEAPSLLQILQGQFSEGVVVIDTNLDSASLPAEDDVSIQHEIDINVGVGVETIIFLTFMPVIDDQVFTPLRFGGGFRSVQLCGFENGGAIMGVTNVRINPATCQLEYMLDGQWITNGDVNACVTAITDPMQAAITANANNIATNTNNIANNQAAITTNANNISALQGDVNQIKTIDIPQINLTLTDNENRISVNETDIADHESRIIVLESASGGSGGNICLPTSKTYFQAADQIKTTQVWESALSIQHQFTYPNALIIVELKANNGNSAPITKFRLRVDADTGTHESWTQSVTVNSIQINDDFSGIDTTQPVDIHIEWIVTGGTGRIFDNQYIQFAIWEFTDVPVPTIDIVNFEANSRPYTLPVGQSGVISSGGNPDNCLFAQSLNDTQYMEVEVDLGSQQTIEDVFTDMICNPVQDTELILYIDDVALGSPASISPIFTSWTTTSLYPTLFPMLGQKVRIRMRAKSGLTSGAMALDNINIVTV